MQSTHQFVRERADGSIEVIDQHVVKRAAMNLLGQISKIEKEEGWTEPKERLIPRTERNRRAAARRVAKKSRKRNGKRK